MAFTLTASGAAQAAQKKRQLAGLFTWRTLKKAACWLVIAGALIALFYAEEDWRGRHAWEHYRTGMAARGVDWKWQALAPPPVPASENFAATPFLAALFDFVLGTHTPRDMKAYNRVAGFAQTSEPYLEARRPEQALLNVIDGQRADLAPGLRLLRQSKHRSGAPAKPETPMGDRATQAALLIEALQEFSPVLDELRLASRRPSARFDLNYNEATPWAVSQPHLPVLKRIGMVLGLRAIAQLTLQNPRAASEDAELIIAVANSLEDEPFEGSFWVRTTLLGIARQTIWEGLADHRWSDRQLRDFQVLLGEPALVRNVSKPLRLDRAGGDYLFSLIHKTPAMVANWRFGPGLWNGFIPKILHWMPSGWMYFEQLSYHRGFDDFLLRGFDPETGHLQPKTVDRTSEKSWPLWNHSLLSSRLLESPVELLTRAFLVQTRIQQTLIACGLERYRLANGEFPANLEALHPQYLDAIPNDLITGTPMKYRLANDGSFILYSVGWNETDDGGKVVVNNGSKEIDPKRGDWVWPK